MEQRPTPDGPSIPIARSGPPRVELANASGSPAFDTWVSGVLHRAPKDIDELAQLALGMGSAARLGFHAAAQGVFRERRLALLLGLAFRLGLQSGLHHAS